MTDALVLGTLSLTDRTAVQALLDTGRTIACDNTAVTV